MNSSPTATAESNSAPRGPFFERLRGGLRSDWSGHVLRQMSRGPMRRIDVRGDRLFSLCGHQRHSLIATRRGGGPPKLLVVGSQRRDLLIVEPLGEQAHHRMTGVAEAALPHLQLEGNVVPVLSAEVRDRRRLPSTVRSVAVDAAGNPFRRVANFGEPLTLGDESRACRVRQRQERRRGQHSRPLRRRYRLLTKPWQPAT